MINAEQIDIDTVEFNIIGRQWYRVDTKQTYFFYPASNDEKREGLYNAMSNEKDELRASMYSIRTSSDKKGYIVSLNQHDYLLEKLNPGDNPGFMILKDAFGIELTFEKKA